MIYDREYVETQYLLKMYQSFLKAYQLDFNSYPVNLHILHDVTVRYWKDVDRLHLFHPKTNKIDCHKIAGYLTYWIAKLKPINIYDNQLYKKGTILLHT